MTLTPIPDGDTAEKYTKPFQDAFKSVYDTVCEAVRQFNNVVHRIHSLRYVLGPALPGWHRLLTAFRNGISKIVDLLNYVTQHAVPVVSLMIQSFKWIDDVQKPMSDVAGKVLRWKSNEFFQWHGDARDIYEYKAGGQQAAAAAVAEKAAFISKWLFTIALTNVDFIAELGKMAAAYLGKVGELAAEAGTIVGLVFAPKDLYEIVGKLVEDGTKILVAIAQRFANAVGDARDLASEVGNRTALVEGRWPQAVNLPRSSSW